MTLLDETTAQNSGSNTALATEPEPAAVAAPAHASESTDPADEPRFAAQHVTEHDTTAQEIAEHEAEQDAQDDKPSGEDFASALETFTTESEEAAAGADRVIKGTVLKLTSTHVVVDIGAKSEGMLPLAEVLDHEGKDRKSVV